MACCAVLLVVFRLWFVLAWVNQWFYEKEILKQGSRSHWEKKKQKIDCFDF